MRPLILSALLIASARAGAAEAPAANWTKGPAKADLAGFAEITVPEGFVFTDAKGTQALMERMGNLVTGQEAGFLAPARIFDEKAANTWFVVFEFNPIGYVKDDEKNSIDAPALLKHMQEGNVRSNEERKRKGLEELDLTGWAVPPHYDAQTHNLEWGLLLRSKAGHESVNYEVRLLGRGGVMQSTLVLGRDGLTKTLPEFRSLLGAYAFKPGQKYAEWRQGDRLAKIGLTALIGGGAVAVAAKSGLLKYVWKYLAVIVVAFAGAIRNLWQRIRRMFAKRTELD